MYKLKTPASRYSELSVSISEKGMLTISSSLFNKMEKFDNKVIADFYLTSDMKTLAIKSSANANFKFLKADVFNVMNYCTYLIEMVFLLQLNILLTGMMLIIVSLVLLQHYKARHWRRMNMLIQLSTWEISNISNLINSIYETYDCNLDKSSCLTIGWISYLECRNLYPYSLFSDDFIQYVSEKISASFSNLRKDRSNRIRITSKCSLYSTFNENGEELINFLPGNNGCFENSVSLWDYAERLGNLKYKILKLMYHKESDLEIIETLHLCPDDYFVIKEQLKEDFLNYINI